jgi:ketosteroid isomerase-like protein
VTPDEFPGVFTRGWARPKPTEFLNFFLPLIAADATFIQPGFPVAVGHDQIARTFRRLFALLPDMTAVPQYTAVTGAIVFVESACVATLSGKPIEFRVCDRFVLRDGKISARHSFSDLLPLLTAVLRHPGTWPRVITGWR